MRSLRGLRKETDDMGEEGYTETVVKTESGGAVYVRRRPGDTDVYLGVSKVKEVLGDG